MGLQKFEVPDKVIWKNFVMSRAKELIKCQERDYQSIDENSSSTSHVGDSNNSDEQIGVWQVTPITGKGTKRKLPSASINSLNKAPLKWVVTDKKMNDGNSNLDSNNEKHCSESNFNNKMFKKASVDLHDNDNNSSDCYEEKITKIDDANHNGNAIDVDSEEETEILIKQPRRNRKKKKIGSPVRKMADSALLNGQLSPSKVCFFC